MSAPVMAVALGSAPGVFAELALERIESEITGPAAAECRWLVLSVEFDHREGAHLSRLFECARGQTGDHGTGYYIIRLDNIISREVPMLLQQPLATVTPTLEGDVLAALARAERAFSGRGLQRFLGSHSHRGVRNALERLAAQGVVLVEEAPPAKLYRLNRDHLATAYIVGLAELASEFFQRLGKRLESWDPAPVYAAVFGSAARGEMDERSDIDVFVVRSDHVAPDHPAWSEQVHGLAEDATRWTGNDVRLFELSAADVATEIDADSPTIRAIAEEGVHLTGPRRYLRSALGTASR